MASSLTKILQSVDPSERLSALRHAAKYGSNSGLSNYNLTDPFHEMMSHLYDTEPGPGPVRHRARASERAHPYGRSKRAKSPPPPKKCNDVDATWDDRWITGHMCDDPNDDGTGFEGLGFTPSLAQKERRKTGRASQLKNYEARNREELEVELEENHKAHEEAKKNKDQKALKRLSMGIPLNKSPTKIRFVEQVKIMGESEIATLKRACW